MDNSVLNSALIECLDSWEPSAFDQKNGTVLSCIVSSRFVERESAKSIVRRLPIFPVVLLSSSRHVLNTDSTKLLRHLPPLDQTVDVGDRVFYTYLKTAGRCWVGAFGGAQRFQDSEHLR